MGVYEVPSIDMSDGVSRFAWHTSRAYFQIFVLIIYALAEPVQICKINLFFLILPV